jgi:hypothetical protein
MEVLMTYRWILVMACLLGVVGLSGCEKEPTQPQVKTLPANRVPRGVSGQQQPPQR